MTDIEKIMTKDELNISNGDWISCLQKSIQSMSNEFLKKQHEVYLLRAANIGKDQEIDRLEKELKIAHEEYARVRNSQCDCGHDFPDNACYDFVSPCEEDS